MSLEFYLFTVTVFKFNELNCFVFVTQSQELVFILFYKEIVIILSK